MKKNWEMKKLGEVCEIVNGGTPDTKVAEYWGGEHLWITPKDMGKLDNIYVDETERKITGAGLKNSSAKILPINSIILSSRAPIGHLAINKKEISTNQGCKGIVPKKGLSNLFLFYFLKNSVELLNSLGSGTTFKELSGSKLSEVKIPIPPLPEQQHIVSILEETFATIDRAKENAEKNLQNARELFDSHLQNAFANREGRWETKTLGDVCKISSKLVDPREAEYIDLLHVGGANIESKKGSLIELKTSREEKLRSGKFLFDETMVLYSKIRPYLMKVALPNFRGLCSADVYPLSPVSNQINRNYLFYLLLSEKFTQYAIQGSDRAGMPKVNRNHLFDFIFSLPPLSEQQSIVAKLDALSTETKRLEEIYQQKLVALDELKKSMLQKAFNGELTGA